MWYHILNMIKSLPKILFILSIVILSYTAILVLINKEFIIEWEIIRPLRIKIKIELIIEWSNTLYSSIVLLISTNVILFSNKYIKSDKNSLRFRYIVICFIISINMLIFIPNMITLLIGWDGLGITSFILIIYYNNQRSNRAGILTIITNRLGDTFLIISIVATLNIGDWSIAAGPINNNFHGMQWLGILVAAITKRAQIPYSAWLPAAIAAPTPVSALVHSSTLVTAGVFLLYRLSNIVNKSNPIKVTIIVSRILTMLLARIRALYENDLKKIIALSTLSQLGLIIVPISLNLPHITIFHISTHAIFKALLFIRAGCLISINAHIQDLRIYGQFTNATPIITASTIISLSAITRVPFIAGYYSKHAIIEWSSILSINIFIFILLLIRIAMTAIYRLRLLIIAIRLPIIQPPLFKIYIPKAFSTSLTIISTISIILGATLQWLVPLNQYNTTIFKNNYYSIAINFIILLIILPLCSLTNINYFCMTSKPLKIIRSLIFTTPMSTQLIIGPYLILSNLVYKHLDQSWIESVVNLGTIKLVSTAGKQGNAALTDKLGSNLNTAALITISTILIITLLCH